MCLEQGDAKQAAELIAPLVRTVKSENVQSENVQSENVQSEKTTPPDNTALRTLLAAVRARAAGDAAGAAEAATLLLELGPDVAAVNGVLVTMLKALDALWKQAEADAIKARTAEDPKLRAAAEGTLTARKQLVAPLAAQLATRKENTLAAQIYIADTNAALGQTDAARACTWRFSSVQSRTRPSKILAPPR